MNKLIKLLLNSCAVVLLFSLAMSLRISDIVKKGRWYDE